MTTEGFGAHFPAACGLAIGEALSRKRLRRWLWGLAALILGVGGLRAAETPPHRLASAALSVFRKHCYECHGRDTMPRGTVRILAHEQLLGNRHLVSPNNPTGSLLLQRVEAGSMPPGRRAKLSSSELESVRAWIAAGAPPWWGNDYLAGHLVDDLRRLPAADRTFVRYVRLEHLWEAPESEVPDPVKEIEPRHKLLLEVLQHFAGVRDDLLASVDEGGGVYRFDLRAIGWERRPFQVVRDDDTREAATLNLYDLLLLDYPLAERPDGRAADDSLKRLQEGYLGPAALVRPILAVRGDWLALHALQAPFDRELKRKPSELPVPEKLDAFRRLASARPPLSRIALRTHDALELSERPETFELAFKTNRPKNVFRPGDALVLTIDNPTKDDFWVEVVYTSGSGSKSLVAAPTVLKAGSQLRLPPEKSDLEYSIDDKSAADYLTIFAARQRFPGGRVLRAEGFRDRLVHPFYALDRDGRASEPPDVQMRTFTLKIVRTDAEN